MSAVSEGMKGVRILALGLVLVAGSATSGRAQSPDQFHVGDRVALIIEAPLALRDTFQVNNGLLITIPNVGDISVKGVRRADAQTYLTQQIGKYVNNPVVKAIVLIRVGVLGPVGRPGYYYVPSDALVSDVLMVAGGPDGNADVGKITIRRNGKEVIGRDKVSSAMTAGKTIADLGIAPGDEMVVKEKASRSFTTYLQVVSVVLGLAVAVISLSRQ